MENQISVLIADNSASSRGIISRILESDPELKIVGKTKNEKETLQKIENFNPKVLLLDVEMPDMDFLSFVEKINSKNSTHIISMTRGKENKASLALDSFQRGTDDFILKPSNPNVTSLNRLKKKLRSKVKSPEIVEKADFKKTLDIASKVSSQQTEAEILLIGGSTGSPRALTGLLSKFPKDFPLPILTVLHMDDGFVKPYAERLDSLVSIRFKVAEEGEIVQAGLGLIAPSDQHMVLKREGENVSVSLNRRKMVNFVRPSVDVLIESAVEIYGGNIIGILLTGMGSDGAKGMKKIKKNGGHTIVQDEDSSVVFGMPKAALDLNCVDVVAPLERIPEKVMNSI